jgi:hypothetical protein
MFLLSKSKIYFLTDEEKISKACEYRIKSFFKMQTDLSKRKDLLLWYENSFMYGLANNYLINTNPSFLLLHEITKKVVHNFGKAIQNALRMIKFYLLNKTIVPSNRSQAIRMMECLYDQ